MDGFFVCGKCHALRGGPIATVDDVAVWQLCDCATVEERTAQPRVWDFSTAFELCRCCGLEALRSGSRWSVWFCAVCNQRVRELNAASGRCIVPIGRHSSMNGVFLDSNADEGLRVFTEQVTSLFHEIVGTEGWSRTAVRMNLAAVGLPMGEDIDLETYTAAVCRLADLKAQRFEEMVNFS